MMGDLISRADAVALINRIALRHGVTGLPVCMVQASDAISAMPAAQTWDVPQSWDDVNGTKHFQPHRADASNDAAHFLVKHGNLTFSAAWDAIRLLSGNGFVITYRAARVLP
jgi:hypothetical protein